VKKIVALMSILFAVASLFSCKNSSPTTPAASNTPNYTQTEVAQYTHTITPTRTASSTITKTSTITQTTTITPTFTLTSTATNSPIPIASYSDLASVPGGTFTQTDGTNSFSHTISAFKMGKYQVTYDLWYMVYTWAIANGYTLQNAGAEGSLGTPGAAPTTAKYQPVTTISWRDAIVWCNAFSQKMGLSPVYYSNVGFSTPIKNSTDITYATSIDPTVGGLDDPYVNWNANGYRLPTEGEYQYAASYKNGSTWTPYNYAGGATADWNNEIATDLVGWDNVNSGSATHSVGDLAANALGIYDMSGNVWEWCFDWHGTYPTTASINYRGLASGYFRVLRGGSFSAGAYYLELGYRDSSNPYHASYDFGFRFARSN
jgi:formylglycine-generating enzyme required for sulfatase activity